MPRFIAHLDMDAFYASVSLLRHPQLRGLPVVIGGRRVPAPPASSSAADFPRLRDYAGRGVVTTATYEARALGVHSAMGIMRAAALAPDAILLPADFEEYSRCSGLFKAAVRDLHPLVEDRGIDEIYIDLDIGAADPVAAAQRLKAAVRAATGLSCSIGIAPNKLLAKIASELDKPDGLTLIRAEDLASRIWPLPARRINGIGPKAGARLEALGITTIGQLATASRAALIAHFGQRYGAWLHEAANGRDDRPVVTSREPKSVSRETTFARDLHPDRDRPELTRILTGLCEQLSRDLERKQLQAKTVGIKVRYEDFRTVTRDTTLRHPAIGAEAIRAAARECLRRVRFDRRIRLLGIRAAGLLPGVPAAQAGPDSRRDAAGRAQSLFDPPPDADAPGLPPADPLG